MRAGWPGGIDGGRQAAAVVLRRLLGGFGHHRSAADRLPREGLDGARDRVLPDADEGVSVADADSAGVLLLDAAPLEDADEVARLGPVATPYADEDLREVGVLDLELAITAASASLAAAAASAAAAAAAAATG